MKPIDELEGELVQWLEGAGSVLVGFSGGVDSSYLAAVAVQTLGPDRTLAAIGRSPSYPESQWEKAVTVAAQVGIPVVEVETREIDDPRYAANPTNRCYFCKSELWSRLLPVAGERGLATVVDGTNADDLADWRPGSQAARESGVQSPLAILGFGKDAIRELSRRRGLATWSQPSSPCLASRLPYGTAVTHERLSQVGRAEEALRALGVEGDLRVRHEGDVARIEIDRGLLPHWMLPDNARRMADAVRAAGFRRVALDLRGFRSGSLNVLHGVTTG